MLKLRNGGKKMQKVKVEHQNYNKKTKICSSYRHPLLIGVVSFGGAAGGDFCMLIFALSKCVFPVEGVGIEALDIVW